MYDYISGKITVKTPTHVVVEANGIGYTANISLYTYAWVKEREEGKIYLHLAVREDALTLYGFADEEERYMFRHLLSVSGVGAGTARMILSSIPPAELQQEIISGNASALEHVKGIGAKTAQRVIIDLKDKLKKSGSDINIPVRMSNTIKDEALSALLTLGFAKNTAEKTLDSLLKKQEYASVENLIKSALNSL